MQIYFDLSDLIYIIPLPSPSLIILTVKSSLTITEYTYLHTHLQVAIYIPRYSLLTIHNISKVSNTFS